MSAVAKTILCTGKVQGVFFRASTRDQARAIGLNGWVKNQPDGSVLIHAEGGEDAIKQFVDWCKKGPPQARVAGVEVSDAEIKGFDSFDISR